MTARNGYWSLVLIAGGFLGSGAVARAQQAAPIGNFQCRDWEMQPTTLQAAFVLKSDGTYEAIDTLEDLTANRPSTTGRFTYNKSTKHIEWTSGKWQDRFGVYMPGVQGTDFIVIRMKKDPEAKVDGAWRCARTQ